MAFLLFLHLIALLYWIGGLTLAGFFLLPQWHSQTIQDQALWQLLRRVLSRFALGGIFAAVLLLISGYGMVLQLGGFGELSRGEWVMVILGTLVALSAGHFYVAPQKTLQRALAAKDYTLANRILGKLTRMAQVMVVLSLLLTAVGTLWA